MRACFDFFGAKKLGGARSPGPSPCYRPAKRSKLEFMTIYERIAAFSMDSDLVFHRVCECGDKLWCSAGPTISTRVEILCINTKLYNFDVVEERTATKYIQIS